MILFSGLLQHSTQISEQRQLKYTISSIFNIRVYKYDVLSLYLCVLVKGEWTSRYNLLRLVKILAENGVYSYLSERISPF